MVHSHTVVATLTGLAAVAGVYAFGGNAMAAHAVAVAVAAGTVATIAVARQTLRESAGLRRSLDRLVMSVMPDDLVVGAIRARASVVAASDGLPVLKPWEGPLLDEPAWVWAFHPAENAPAGAMLILGQEDLARLVLLGEENLDGELRKRFFTPDGRSLEEMWDELTREVSLAAGWAFRQQPSASLVGVAKYASIQTRELGAAPKTVDGIDVSRERVFGQADLDALSRQSRAARTLAFVERFAQTRLVAPSAAKERLIAG